MPEFVVQNHPQRQQIIELLARGVPPRTIAATVSPTVSFSAIQRFKRASLPPQPIAKPINISEIRETTQALEAGTIPPPEATPTLRGLVDKLSARQERALDRAENAVRVVDTDDGLKPVGEDLKILAPMFKARIDSLRLLGELTGELNQANSASPNITINIVAQSAPAPAAASQPYDLEIAPTDEIGSEGG